MIAAPSTSREATLTGVATGLVGTLTARVINPPAGTVVVAETTSNITEGPTGTYTWVFTTPSSAGQYLIVWDYGGSEDPVEELEVTWSSAAAASPPDGSPLFTVAQVRARGIAESVISDDNVETLRAAIENELERALGVSVVPRTATNERLSGNGSSRLLLPHRRVSAFSAASVDGVSLTTDELADVILDGDELYWPAGWTRGVRNVLVTYTHGYASPPGLAPRAGLDLLDVLLTSDNGLISPRASALTNDIGTLALVTAGVRGALFSVPSCNALVSMYGIPRVG